MLKAARVNALSQAHSISTSEKLEEWQKMYGVNALSRVHSISIELAHDVLEIAKVCQCPVSGSFHFYDKMEESWPMMKECVNALSRAHSISTLSARKP